MLNSSTLVRDAREEFSGKLAEAEEAQKKVLAAIDEFEKADIVTHLDRFREEVEREVESIRDDLVTRDRRWKRELSDAQVVLPSRRLLLFSICISRSCLLVRGPATAAATQTQRTQLQPTERKRKIATKKRKPDRAPSAECAD